MTKYGEREGHQRATYGSGFRWLLLGAITAAAAVAALPILMHDAEATGPPPMYTLNVYIDGSGPPIVNGQPTTAVAAGCTVTLSPSGGTYSPGTQVTVTAVPASGWLFDHWVVPDSGSTNGIIITMDSNKAVMPVFVHSTYYTMSTAVYPAGIGSVSPSWGSYAPGSQATITANAPNGYRFNYWGSYLFFGYDNPANVPMNRHRLVTAHFLRTHTLTTYVNGSGSVSPSGGTYDSGEVVSLLATPDPGWRFSHWWGRGTANPLDLTMSADQYVTAEFVPQCTLTTSVSPAGKGTVQVSPAPPYYVNDTVTLTATPEPGYQFLEWQGGLTGTNNPAQLTLPGDTTVTAMFERDGTFFLTVNTDGNGSITVWPDYASYLPGTVVYLTSVDGMDATFDYWSGDMTPGEDPALAAIQITMDSDRSLTANFLARPGVSAIDMLEDLEDFLLEINETASIQTWDINGLIHDDDFNRVFVGNGMPDAMELYLLERVLTTRRLGLTWRGGVSHDAIWDMWSANLAQAQSDMPGVSAVVQRVAAAYMTYGTFESSVAIQDVLQTRLGITVAPMDYQKNGRRYLAPQQDADNDGTLNRQEWEIAAPTGDFADKDGFASAALDGVPPGAAGSAPSATSCANALCLALGDVLVSQPVGVHYGPPGLHGELLPSSWGSADPAGSDIPLGTTIAVNANGSPGDGWSFVHWDAPDSLLHGSIKVSDSFPLTNEDDDQTVQALYIRYALELPYPSPYISISASGSHVFSTIQQVDGEERRFVIGPEGATVTLSATSSPPLAPVRGWVVKGGPSGADPRYSFTSTVRVRLGTPYAAPYTGVAPVEDKISVSAGSTEGGMVIGSHANAWPGVYSGTFISTTVGNYVSFTPVPDPGYQFAGWNWAWPSEIIYADPADVQGLRANFVMIPRSSLTLEVTGDDPGCSGYIAVDPPKKYYMNETVTLTAKPTPACCQGGPHVGYRFRGWDGDGAAVDGTPISEVTSTTLHILMGLGDRKIQAEFVKKKPYVIALGGLGSTPDPPGQNGIFVWASGLSGDLYDVHQYSQADVGWEDGEGTAFNDLAAEINATPGLQIIIAGHSYGGGAVANLCQLIESEMPTQQNPSGGRIHRNDFSVILTMYVDAITQNGLFPETRYPAVSSYHVNVYQRITPVLNGNAVPGAEYNRDINTLACASCVYHTGIDNCPVTHDILSDFLELMAFGCPRDWDYCDSSSSCEYCGE